MNPIMKVILMMLVGAGLVWGGLALAATTGPVGGLGYTCSDNPGEKKTCTCTGAADCWWMGRSGVCEGEVIVLTCDNNGKCTCDWKKKAVNPDSRFINLQGKFLTIEIK